MKRKRLTAVFAVCSLILSSCAGGREAQPSVTETTTTAETTNLKELDNEIDWDGMADIESIDVDNEAGTGKLYESGKKAGLVKALCYYDLAETQPELAELLAQRYGGTIETEITSSGSAYFDRLGVLIASGSSPDIVRYDWMAYPTGISKGMYTPLDDWLDMDSPVWSGEKEVIESFNYLGKHCYFPSSVQTNFAMIYNKLSLQEAGLPDPMDLYFDGNWTWDTFEDLLIEWQKQGDDYVGFTGGSWSAMMFANTTGVKIIDMTGTDIINNMKNSDVQRAMDWCARLKKQGFVGDGFVDPGTAFIDGKLLFLGMGLTWGYESAQETMFKKGLDADIAAVPFPRDPNADKYYLASDTFGFLVPSGAQNVQGAVDWILCGRMYETDPEIVAKDHAEKMDTSPVYYAKCSGCKYNFTENNNEDLSSCPECGTARKQKFKATYSEQQLQVIDDMINPEKFSFVFDNSLGFNDDFSAILIGDETSLYDGPLYYGSSYSQLRDTNYGVVESYLEPYRELLKQ